MIKQIIADEIIQTKMALDVDGLIVSYRKCEDFSYEFWWTLNDDMTADDCKDIIDRIVSLMESQSYDHGASWREIYRKANFEDEWTYTCRVYFRKRDAG